MEQQQIRKTKRREVTTEDLIDQLHEDGSREERRRLQRLLGRSTRVVENADEVLNES